MERLSREQVCGNYVIMNGSYANLLIRLIISLLLAGFSSVFTGCGDDASRLDLLTDANLSDAGDTSLADVGWVQDQDVCSVDEHFFPGDGCVDVTTDHAHCGGCSAACEQGQVCVEGECTYSCSPGQNICGDQCANLAKDPEHCGECDNECDRGYWCEEGICVLSCPSGQTACNGQCVDTEIDLRHCGACDAACAQGQVCVASECTYDCSVGLIACGNQCVNIYSDPLNCGKCGEVCPDGMFCSCGECSLYCEAGLEPCGSRCINLQTDRNHCGGCDLPCDAGSACVAGICIVPVTGVSLDVITLKLDTGATHQLEATVTPADATNQDLIWASSNPDIATVDEEGVVEGVNPGQTQIIVHTVDGGHFASCVVNVTKPVIGISIAPSKVTLSPGQTTTIHASVNPADATNKSLTWHSTHIQVATVDASGLVTAKGDGQATITATTVDGNFQGSCLVTVASTQVTDVTLTPQEVHIILGEEFQLTAMISPDEATNKVVVWHSSDPAVVSVDQFGQVTGLAEGSVTIMAITMDGGFHDTCTVHVRVPVLGVSLNATTLAMERGDKVALQHTIVPADATNKVVTWESSDPSIATVTDAGLITAYNHGEATITVTTADGQYSASVQVSVWVPLIGITLVHSTGMVGVNQTITLVPTFDPPDASDRNVVWSTTHPEIAVVNLEGVVTGRAIGEATIVITNLRTGLRANFQVRVIIRSTGITISPEALELGLGQSATITATVLPPEAHVKEVEWTTQDALVARVGSEGLVTGVGIGQTQITATTVDGGWFARAAVEVAAIPVEGVTVAPSSLALVVGDTGQLTVTIAPAEATDKSVVWASDNEAVATVSDDGLVTAHSIGSATITVTTVDGGYMATATITVSPPAGYVLIPAGTFTMGSPSGELGRMAALETQHQVTLTRSFLMKITEVTQGEWQTLMGYNPAYFKGCGANCPVEQVNWREALAYANAMSAVEGVAQCFDCTGGSCSLRAQYTKPQDCPGYRLPTEAEWEYAARAGTTTAFHTGNITGEQTCSNMNAAGWYAFNSGSTTRAVKGKLANAWGLYDMHGNVEEWTWDWYQENLGSTAVTDPAGPPNGMQRVFRGGSWNHYARSCRAAYRSSGYPGTRSVNIGFRLARSM